MVDILAPELTTTNFDRNSRNIDRISPNFDRTLLALF